MPEKPLIQVDVSWKTPKILFLGADSFLGRNFLRQLLGKELEIWAVVNRQEKIESKPHLQVLSLAQDWISEIPGEIDYLVDFLNFPESFSLAQKNNSRILTVWNEEEGKLELEKERETLDWRVARAAYVYGPTEDWESSSFLNQVLVKAVLNEKIAIPFSQLGKVHPLYLTDFNSFLEQALFSPTTEKEEFFLAGPEVSWQKFLDYLQEKSQFTQGVRVDPDLVLPEVKTENQAALFEKFGRSPATSWQSGIDKTLQFLFQKKEKGELRALLKEKRFLLPRKGFQTRVVKEDFLVKEETKEKPGEEKKEKATIDQAFWEIKKEVIKKEKKESKTTAKPVVVKTNWEKEKEEKEPSFSPPLPVAEKKTRKKLKFPSFSLFPWLFLVLLFLVYFFNSFFWGGFYFILGGFRACKSFKLAEFKHWPEVQAETQKANQSLLKALDFYQRLGSEFFLFWSRSVWKGVLVLEKGAVLAQQALNLNRAIWEEEGNSGEIIDRLQIDQEVLQRQLALLETELINSEAFFPFNLNPRLTGWQKKIDQAQLVLEKSSRLLPQASWWLGENQPRRFLIVFQNNMELRPSGGFIGSLATLEVSGGKIVQFKVEDVYTIDGQLKGHVEPPKQIREILGETSWFLRDSNWSPDFPTSAEQISWFYQKETGQEADAVFALNLTAAQKILREVGEVYLPDFEEKINADNLFAKAQFYSESNFFPGSSQKASFLSALSNQILLAIQSQPDQLCWPLSLAVWESLEEKELLLFTKSKEVNQALLANNWDGRVKSLAIARDNSFSDFLFPVEANLGVNKANHFLRRSLNLSLEFKGEEKLEHFLQIYYENTSQTKQWPSGDYKNYLRLLLPLGTQVEKILIFDPLKGKKESGQIISRNEVSQDQEKGKLVLGFLVEVPINSRRVVEVTYFQKLDLPKDNWDYLFYLQKQSGAGDTPFSVLFSFPDGFKPLQTSQPAVLTERGLLFEGVLKSDWPIGIEFGR